MFYLDLFQKLDDKKIRYVLIGGVAMNLHGVPRMTMDVDLLLAMDEENLRAFLEVSEELKLQPVAPVSPNDLLDEARRRAWVEEKHMTVFALRPQSSSGPTVDIMIDSPIDIDEALRRAEVHRVQGVAVSLASIQDMIELKEKAGRAQDLSDIEHLKRLQKH